MERLRPPQRGLRPAQVRDLRGSHAAGARYFLRVSRESEVAANETPDTDRLSSLGVVRWASVSRPLDRNVTVGEFTSQYKHGQILSTPD